MSLSISGSRYVRVYNPTLRFEVSDKIIFAELSSSRKTGNVKTDKITGEVLTNPATGDTIPERKYSRWKGRFVGNAFEAAKGLRSGDSIDVITGWITAEKFPGTDGKEHISYEVTIAEFVPSNVEEGDDANTTDEE